METLTTSVMGAANAAIAWVIGRLGLSPAGAQLLEVRGRRTGKTHAVPVNPLEFDGNRYLFSGRGESQWVKNFRAADEATLRVGDRSERIVLVRELADEEKPQIIRAYLDRWYWEVRSFIGVPKDASLDQLAAIAPQHPVFEIGNSGQSAR